MRVFKYIRGLSSHWLAFIPIALSTAMVWLPVADSHYGIALRLTASLIALALSSLFLSRLPRPAIAVSCDDFSISTNLATLTFDEITGIEMVDCGQIAGWTIVARDDTRKTRPVVLAHSQIQSGNLLLDHMLKNAETAKLYSRTRLFGSPFDWLVSLAIAVLVTGIARLVLGLIA